jgi:hypothetical protein
MYDAIGANVSAIPLDAQMVAGYPQPHQLPGIQWTAEDWELFPKAAQVRIANVSDDWEHCSVVDVELNALSPAEARQFITARNSFRPGTATVYVDRAGLPQLLRACAPLAYNLWLAWWLNRPPGPQDLAIVRELLPPQVELVAWQWRNAGAYDINDVLDEEWHPQP